MLLCLSFCFVSLIQSSSVFPRIHFSPVCEFLVIPCNYSHCENGSFEVLFWHQKKTPLFCSLGGRRVSIEFFLKEVSRTGEVPTEWPLANESSVFRGPSCSSGHEGLHQKPLRLRSNSDDASRNSRSNILHGFLQTKSVNTSKTNRHTNPSCPRGMPKSKLWASGKVVSPLLTTGQKLMLFRFITHARRLRNQDNATLWGSTTAARATTGDIDRSATGLSSGSMTKCLRLTRSPELELSITPWKRRPEHCPGSWKKWNQWFEPLPRNRTSFRTQCILWSKKRKTITNSAM